jgi:putative ABC transport system permease protein
METLSQDVRYNFRLLRRDPGFALLLIVTLTLGVAAATTIFSVVNAVLISPLPYKDAGRLVLVWERNVQKERLTNAVSPANFADWRDRLDAFEDIGASRDQFYTLTGQGEPEMITSYRFSANFFPLLGVAPALGRTFAPEEDRPGQDRVVVLSHKLWQRRFGGDRSVVGRPITLNGENYSVVGVMPPNFDYPGGGVELWTPLALTPAHWDNRSLRALRLLARLKPGVTPEQAQAKLAALTGQLAAQYPETNAGWDGNVERLRDNYAGDIRLPLLVLLGAVCFVLLIACANVTNLLLVRTTARQRELTLRTALGASRSRIVRQLVTEGLTLSLIGSALGLLLALWSVNSLLALFPTTISNFNIPRLDNIPFDARVLLFALGLTLLTGMVFGVTPWLQTSKVNLNDSLKEGGRSTSGRGRRLLEALVVAEVGLAMVLLVGAGLMIRSFIRLQQTDLGFRTENALSLRMTLPAYKYSKPEQRGLFVEEVLRQVSAVQGVAAAGTVNFLPLSGWQGSRAFTVEGQQAANAAEQPEADYRVVSADYFKAMGIPLLSGRQFDARDAASAPQVAIVNEVMARRFFPGQDPLGKRVNVGGLDKPDWRQVVGVVGAVRHLGLADEPRPEIYRPFSQDPFPLVSLVVRSTTTDPQALAASVRNAIRAVDKDQPISYVMSMGELAAESLALRRVTMYLITLFAVIALFMAAVGIYGVMAYSVSQRTREIGIRIALGAQRRDIMRLVVGRGLLLTVCGLGLGLVSALLLTRLVSSLLYGVSAADPLTVAGISIFLAAVAFLASYVPARRAVRVDPLVALRDN